MLSDGQADLTKLRIAFRHFANTPKTVEFDWFTGTRKRTKTIIRISTEKVLSLADCSGLNKQEVSEQFLCWVKLWETWYNAKTRNIYNADKSGCQMRNGPTKRKSGRVLWKGEKFSALWPAQKLLQFSSTDDYLQKKKMFKICRVFYEPYVIMIDPRRTLPWKVCWTKGQ